uniref:diacylglycerol O-acyltransferase n=1 Tax=Leptocylindrus danicus TaxID=163516 RepID=A0A7S2NUE9_9STRA
MRKRVPVVPVYVFGCSDYFLTSTVFYNVRHTLMKKFGICIPLCRGLYNSMCPLPIKTTIVFGEPMELFDIMGEEKRQPTEEELSAAHDKFCVALRDLFDKHKTRLGYADRTLTIK